MESLWDVDRDCFTTSLHQSAKTFLSLSITELRQMIRKWILNATFSDKHVYSCTTRLHNYAVNWLDWHVDPPNAQYKVDLSFDKDGFAVTKVLLESFQFADFNKMLSQVHSVFT